MNCPACATSMTAETLHGHLGTSVVVDCCLDCQAFWFDRFESLQLEPRSTLRLFELIGHQTAQGRPRRALSSGTCPRCRSALLLTHDRQRNTPFQYWRCDNEHGRLIAFYQFLREKDFIRPLSPQQLEELRRNIETVSCSNCGAAIDLSKDSSCAHCGTPLSILDASQAQRLIAQLQQADRPPAPNAQPPAPKPSLDEVARAIHSLGDPTWRADAAAGGLVAAGLTALARTLSQRVR